MKDVADMTERELEAWIVAENSKPVGDSTHANDLDVQRALNDLDEHKRKVREYRVRKLNSDEQGPTDG